MIAIYAVYFHSSVTVRVDYFIDTTNNEAINAILGRFLDVFATPLYFPDMQKCSTSYTSQG